jgi:putative ABC transport system permease protein
MSVLEAASLRLPREEKARVARSGMGLFEPFRVALDGLLANKLRSFLTALGIIIGVSTVIIMVAMGEGAARASEAAIRKLGTNRLYVRPGDRMVGGVRGGVGSSTRLKLEDADLLRRKLRHATLVVPEYRGNAARVIYRNKNTQTDIWGSTPQYFAARNLPIVEGRSFTEQEVQQKARVAVLGHNVYRDLYNGGNAVGTTLRINGQSFRVVGVQGELGGMPFGNRDDQITIPISTAIRRLFYSDHINSISIQAASEDKMRELEDEIKEIMAKAHKIPEGEEPDVRIFNQADLLETASSQSAFLTALLAGIALVSLVVGGIGIMNIMLVSVTERTREIGIRKAIGAKRKHILYQFLIESVTLCLVGGLLGVGIGVGVSFWMGRSPDEGGLGFPMQLSPMPTILAFCSAAIVGVFFGIYPAVKASALDPIIALRKE